MSSPLSAFTAIPNPQMPAFLGAQSFIMMYQAGEGWQYGKRRISALSNEEFNKLTPQSLMERQAMELKGAIPIIERSMNAMTRMVPMIIEQYGDFIKEAINAMPQFAQNIVGGQAGANLQSNMEGFDDILKSIAASLQQNNQGGNVGFNQAEFLAYAKILLQQELDKQNAGKITTPAGQNITIVSKPSFQGPGINTITGEQSEASKRAVAARLQLQQAKPQVHVRARPRSNVSLQSLTIEKAKLTQAYTRQKLIYDKMNPNDRIARNNQWTKVKKAELDYANFFKMHGSRF